jgi:hypothetical protein
MLEGFYLQICIFVVTYICMCHSTDLDYHILLLSVEIISLHLGKVGMNKHATAAPLNKPITMT